MTLCVCDSVCDSAFATLSVCECDSHFIHDKVFDVSIKSLSLRLVSRLPSISISKGRREASPPLITVKEITYQPR